jgi:hypothetical protein
LQAVSAKKVAEHLFGRGFWEGQMPSKRNQRQSHALSKISPICSPFFLRATLPAVANTVQPARERAAAGARFRDLACGASVNGAPGRAGILNRDGVHG